MNFKLRLTGAICALLLPSLGCDLLNVTDSEQAVGRGSKVFDPYTPESGATRLSLQWFNGCAVTPSGQASALNGVPIPYPDTCPNLNAADPTRMRSAPTGTTRLLAGTRYFLNQLTLMDSILNEHNDPADLSGVVRWMRTQSRFKNLDWTNLGQVSDEWVFNAGIEGATQDSWTREVLFDNANWRQVKGDTFTIQVLDFAGEERGTPVVYDRSELLSESPFANRSRVGWRMESVLPPLFPGDNSVRQLPLLPGFPPTPPAFRTTVKFDLVGSANPFKTLTIPDLRGPGALRVTWSQLPGEHFYFPVTFVSREDLLATCTDPTGNPIPCGFGVDPQFSFGKPANGKYFEPGETLNVVVQIKDGVGNRLHEKDFLPSGADMLADNTNGLMYAQNGYFFHLLDRDVFPGYMIAGPLHKLTTRSDPNEPAPFFVQENDTMGMVDDLATLNVLPGVHTAKWSTHLPTKFPETGMEAGTYLAVAKASRYYLGERTSKSNVYFFQVGQSEPTTYPGNVGNCQICHRGVLSLNNLRHGLSVDDVEACKVCHQRDSDLVGRLQVKLHQIHMQSPRYTADKRDCGMCHLTRESAVRPSMNVCSSCHPSVHGSEYFSLQFANRGVPNRFGNCAQSCHVDNLPQNHFLP